MRKPRKKVEKFIKHDEFKSRLDLLPPDAIEFIGYVLRHGALTYAPGNWRKCKDPGRYVAATLRHIMKHMKGDFLDKDSHLPHLAHAVCSALFALDLILRGEQNTYDMGNYFAIVKRRSKTRGVVVKRFTSYSKAWEHMESHELDQAKHVIKTVTVQEKIGSSVRA